jgi:hypothetical protein
VVRGCDLRPALTELSLVGGPASAHETLHGDALPPHALLSLLESG